jgi:hypothetical protein
MSSSATDRPALSGAGCDRPVAIPLMNGIGQKETP